MNTAGCDAASLNWLTKIVFLGYSYIIVALNMIREMIKRWWMQLKVVTNKKVSPEWQRCSRYVINRIHVRGSCSGTFVTGVCVVVWLVSPFHFLCLPSSLRRWPVRDPRCNHYEKCFCDTIPGDRQGAVYTIPGDKIKYCDCLATYIDETGRNLSTRLTEHK